MGLCEVREFGAQIHCGEHRQPLLQGHLGRLTTRKHAFAECTNLGLRMLRPGRFQHQETLQRAAIIALQLCTELRKHLGADGAIPVRRSDKSRRRGDRNQTAYMPGHLQRGLLGKQAAKRPSQPHGGRRDLRNALHNVGEINRIALGAEAVTR